MTPAAVTFTRTTTTIRTAVIRHRTDVGSISCIATRKAGHLLLRDGLPDTQGELKC
jgi:hypothetical protein